MSDSEDETVDAPSSSLFLGLADDEPVDFELTLEDSFIGGQPLWIKDVAPSKELVQCKNCDELMSLLLQISAPIPGQYYDRVLYVFACHRIRCRRQPGTVRALRGVYRDLEQEEAERKAETSASAKVEPLSTLGSQIFGGTANPFASGQEKKETKEISIGTEGTDTSGKGADIKGKSTKQSNSKSSKLDLPALPCFALYDVVHENFQPIKHEKPKVVMDNTEEGEEEEIEKHQSDQWQRIADQVSDETFIQFQDRVGQNPDQVVRYDLKGLEPLFFSKDSVYRQIKQGKVPGRLELQLMPYIIDLVDGDDVANGMEWGTIFVATAADDHMDLGQNKVGYMEEWVGVQWEGGS